MIYARTTASADDRCRAGRFLVMTLIRRVLVAAPTVAVISLGLALRQRSQCAAAVPAAAPRASEESRTGLRAELARLRPKTAEMVERWANDDHAGWCKLPARAWPAHQPAAEEVPALRVARAACCGAGSATERCELARFSLATALVFAGVSPHEGLREYLSLAGQEHTDGMVGAGTCLIEGFDGDEETLEDVHIREQAGVAWLARASELDNAQGHYELGVLYCTCAR